MSCQPVRRADAGDACSLRQAETHYPLGGRRMRPTVGGRHVWLATLSHQDMIRHCAGHEVSQKNKRVL